MKKNVFLTIVLPHLKLFSDQMSYSFCASKGFKPCFLKLKPLVFHFDLSLMGPCRKIDARFRLKANNRQKGFPKNGTKASELQ